MALFLAYVMFPLVGILPGVLVPFPAIFYSLKSGRTVGVAIVAVVMLALAIMADYPAFMLYVLQCGLISLALPVFLAAGKGGARSIVFTVAVNMVVILLLAVVYGALQGVNLHAQVLKGVQTSIAQTADLYSRAGIKGDDLKTLQQGLEQVAKLISRIYPALVAVSLGCIAGINLQLLRRFINRFSEPWLIGEFTGFRNPDQLVWVLIAAGFAMLVPDRHVTTAAMNLLIVVVSIYFVQGMAIISSFFAIFTVPKFARFLFYLVLALQPYLSVPVAALGIFDIWGDFRSPRKQENL